MYQQNQQNCMPPRETTEATGFLACLSAAFSAGVAATLVAIRLVK